MRNINDAGPMPVVEMLTGGVQIIDDIAGEWRQLCREKPNDLPYYRPEWVAEYMRSFISPGEFLLLTARGTDGLDAVLPLIKENKLLTYMPAVILRTPAEYDTWPYDIVARPGSDGKSAVRALWEFIKTYRLWDMIELPNVPQAGHGEELLQLARADGYPIYLRESMRTPFLQLTGWDASEDPLNLARSTKLRSNLRSVMRKIDSQGGMIFQHYDDASPEFLDNFYELESAGWKGQKGTAIACMPKMQNFIDGIVKFAEQFGYLLAGSLQFKGRTMAASIGLTYSGRYFGLKLAVDEQLRNYSPGHLLVYSILCDCVRRGLSECNLGGIWSDWKGQWTERTANHNFCYIFRKGFYGSAIKIGAFTLLPDLKKRIRGWIGHN